MVRYCGNSIEFVCSFVGTVLCQCSNNIDQPLNTLFFSSKNLLPSITTLETVLSGNANFRYSGNE